MAWGCIGLGGDLKKAMKDGKPIIIEGRHLDPSIYLMNDENKTPSNDPEKSSSETNSSKDLTSDKNPEASSSNTKETDNSAVKPHSHEEAVASVEANNLSEKVTQCTIDGMLQSIFSVVFSSCDCSSICFYVSVKFYFVSCVCS
jgi:hypothetical protein